MGFGFGWLRRIVRRKMHPIEPDVARSWKTMLSMGYAILAWNILGFTVYSFLKDKVPKKGESVDYAKLLGVKNANIIRYSNFTKTDEYEMNLQDSDIKEYYDIYVNKIKPEPERVTEVKQENISE